MTTAQSAFPLLRSTYPLTAGRHERRIGVLEIYLPYGPIAADSTPGCAL